MLALISLTKEPDDWAYLLVILRERIECEQVSGFRFEHAGQSFAVDKGIGSIIAILGGFTKGFVYSFSLYPIEGVEESVSYAEDNGETRLETSAKQEGVISTDTHLHCTKRFSGYHY